MTLLAAAIKDPNFEREHPRGRDGRFLEKGGFVKFLDIKANLWRLAKVIDFTDDGKVKVEYTGADGKPVEDIMRKNWLYHADRPKATLSPTTMKRAANQRLSGSNVGALFEDKAGNEWYIKTPQSKLHTGNENLMNRLYVKAGAPAPETAVSPDGRNFLTKIEDSVDWHTLSGDRLETVKKIAAKNFVVDAWLANWDAALNDNIRVTPENVVLRVDAGGAGMFRARGERRMLTMDVKELQSMRDPSMTGRSGGAELYGTVTSEDEVNAAKRILAINPDDIKTMVSEEGLPQVLATELIARRAWLATHYSLTLPESTPEGQALLDSLTEAKTAAEKESAEAAVKALIKIAPDAPVALGPGAPVWIKDKKIGALNVGTKVPDLMVVDWQTDYLINFKSKDGKTEYTVGANDTAAFEVLRENNASANTAYLSGEKPQIGDRVDQKTGGLGVVTEMFPLYMRVMGDDHKSRVSRIDKNTLVAKVGEHDMTALALAGPGSMANIGKPADLSNADAKFPLIAFSLPHRANVLVIAYDDTTQKAKVMLSNGGAATLPATKLFDNDSVDKDAVRALPTAQKRAMSPRAKKAAAPLDVTTLPDIEIKPNRMVQVKLSTGDRLLKGKNKSRLDFLIIRRDGTVEYAGSNKSDTDSDGWVVEGLKHDYAMIKQMLSGSTVLTDVTPAKYDVASNDLGPDKLRFKKRKLTVTSSAGGLDVASFNDFVELNKADLSKIGRYSLSGIKKSDETYKFDFTPEAGDEMTSIVDSGSPVGGIRSNKIPYYGFTESTDDDGNTISAKTKLEEMLADETSYTYVPRFWLKRADGSVYDLGYGGEYAEDQTKWKDARQSDLDKVKAMHDEYWYSGYGDPEPEDTLSDGTKIRYSTKDQNRGTGVNQIAENRAWLLGKAPAPTGRTYRYGPTPATSYDGSASLLEALQTDVDQWDKGNLDALAQKALDVPSGARRTYSETQLDAMPAGKRLFIATLNERLEKTNSGTWLRVSADMQGTSSWLSGYDVLDPSIPTEGPLPAAVGEERKFTADELALFPAGTKLVYPGSGNRKDWTLVKQTDQRWERADDYSMYLDADLQSLNAPYRVDTVPVSAVVAVDPAAPVTDFTETAGYKALTHSVATTREHINDGTLDDTIHKVMTTTITSSTDYGARGIHRLPDGTSHGDPFMALFAKEYEGDQQVLNAPTPLFNAIKNMTGHPSMYRGVSAVDQRDAIKHGDHFNGTGTYGNGVYTSADRGDTSSYGSARVELTPKPGAKGIQNDEMYLRQAEDMSKAVQDRHDAISSGTTLPTSQTISSTDFTKPQDPTLQAIVDDVVKSVLTSRGITSTTDADRREILNRGAVKAAIAYKAVFDDAKLQAVVTVERAGYYGDTKDEKIVLTVRQTPRQGGGHTPGTMKLTFENPWSQGSTNFGRAQAKKLDPTRDYMVKTSLLEAAPGKTWKSSEDDRINQVYNSGWWKDNFTNHLEASGIGEAIADNSSDWQTALEKTRKLDSRISFISDPGRWSLAAGYDFFFIPGVNYYIFTHRAGFIVKK